jgi:hypothetical protein
MKKYDLFRKGLSGKYSTGMLFIKKKETADGFKNAGFRFNGHSLGGDFMFAPKYGLTKAEVDDLWKKLMQKGEE